MKDDLLKHSGIVFIATMMSSFLAYVYHFYLARALGPADYGALGALISLTYIISVPSGTIQTVISRFVSRFKSKGDYDAAASVFFGGMKNFAVMGGAAFLLILLLSPFIASFLKAPTLSVIALGGFAFISFLIPLQTGIFIGLEKFKTSSFFNVFGVVLRLAFAFLFVSMGLGVTGGIMAMAVPAFIVFAISFLPMRFLFGRKKTELDKSEFYSYSFPVLATTLCLMAAMNVDVMLVRNLFSPEESGVYSAVSMIARVIFFSASSIALALFPKASALSLPERKSSNLLKKALLYTGGISFACIVAYFLMSDFILGTFFGPEYISGARLLGPFAISISLLSIVYVVTYYKLAVSDYSFLPAVAFFTILEAAMIWIFHESMLQVISVMGLSMSLMLIAIFVFPRVRGRRNRPGSARRMRIRSPDQNHI